MAGLNKGKQALISPSGGSRLTGHDSSLSSRSAFFRCDRSSNSWYAVGAMCYWNTRCWTTTYGRWMFLGGNRFFCTYINVQGEIMETWTLFVLFYMNIDISRILLIILIRLYILIISSTIIIIIKKQQLWITVLGCAASSPRWFFGCVGERFAVAGAVAMVSSTC